MLGSLERLDMDITTTVRVGLRTLTNGTTLSTYRCVMFGMEGIQTDEETIDYVRTRINNDWGLNRGMLLNCIDNLDYSIERK